MQVYICNVYTKCTGNVSRNMRYDRISVGIIRSDNKKSSVYSP